MIERTVPIDADGRRTRRSAQRRAGTWRARTAVVALAAVIALVAVELFLDAVPRRLMPGTVRTIVSFYTRRAEWRQLIEGDRYLGFKLRPNVEIRFPFEGGTILIRTTDYGLGPIGFRDLGTRPPFDAIAVGDSFTFCDEVVARDCWVRRLSDATGASIATLGVSGYSNIAEARILKQYGPRFGGRLVLLGFFPNDLADNVNFDRWARSGSDDLSAWLEQARERRSPMGWLEERSTLYRVLSTAVASRSRTIRHYVHGNLDLVLRFDNWWLRTIEAPDRHPGWPLMQDALLDMQRTARDMHARLVVLVFPTKEEAYWNIAEQYWPALRGVDINALPRLITQFLAEHGIAGCDLTREIRARAALGRQLYHRISGHFNEAGNRVAASAIGACLATHGLLTAR